MKKLFILLAILALPLATFGAVQVVKTIKWYDFIVQIETRDGGNIFVNKFEDAGNTCYIMTNDKTKWDGISCVNSVKK